MSAVAGDAVQFWRFWTRLRGDCRRTAYFALACYQSRSQPAAIYGDKRAEILWDNMESIVFYRPAIGNRSTMRLRQLN